MKTKKFQRNIKRFGRKLKEIETINGGKKLSMGKIFKKLGSSLMMICG